MLIDWLWDWDPRAKCISAAKDTRRRHCQSNGCCLGHHHCALPLPSCHKRAVVQTALTGGTSAHPPSSTLSHVHLSAFAYWMAYGRVCGPEQQAPNASARKRSCAQNSPLRSGRGWSGWPDSPGRLRRRCWRSLSTYLSSTFNEATCAHEYKDISEKKRKDQKKGR